MTMVGVAGKSAAIEVLALVGLALRERRPVRRLPGLARPAQDFVLPFSTAALKLVSKPLAASKGLCSIPALA